jgi:glycine/D-amino acid oxidase-like deaminating enzyme
VEAGVKVGQDFGGRPIDDPDSPAEIDPENLAAVMAWVRRRLPHLEPVPIKVEHCLYTATPDRHFILDRHPREPRVTIAAGFSGHGFKFAPALGEIVSALALGEPPPVELGTFRLGRFGG